MRKNLFDNIKTDDSIFKDKVTVDGHTYSGRDILGPEYLPSNILHRSQQLMQMAHTLSTSLNGQLPSSILVFGKTGTGKTAATRVVLDDLVNKLETEPIKIPVHCRYINCSINYTPHAIFANLTNSFMGADEKKLLGHPGKSLSKVYDSLVDLMDGINIIVLDEIEKLVFKDGSNVLYDLMEINSNKNSGRVSIIGISNNFEYEERINPKVRSRLNAAKLIFPPYGVHELINILKTRAELAFNPKTFAYSVINAAATAAASIGGGDARYAIGLLKQAADIAVQKGVGKLSEAHIRQARGPLEKKIELEGVRNLTESARFLLGIINSASSKYPRKPFWTSGEVYEVYQAACQYLDRPALVQRRIVSIVSSLEEGGFIEATKTSFGQGQGKGRTRKIRQTNNLLLADILYDSPDGGKELADSVSHYLKIKEKC